MWACEEAWGRCGIMYEVSIEGVEKCVGVWGKVRGDVGEGT